MHGLQQITRVRCGTLPEAVFLRGLNTLLVQQNDCAKQIGDITIRQQNRNNDSNAVITFRVSLLDLALPQGSLWESVYTPHRHCYPLFAFSLRRSCLSDRFEVPDVVRLQ